MLGLAAVIVADRPGPARPSLDAKKPPEGGWVGWRGSESEAHQQAEAKSEGCRQDEVDSSHGVLQ